MAKRLAGISIISDIISPYFPNLNKKLEVAEIKKSPHEFLDWVVFSALFSSIIVSLAFAGIFYIYNFPLLPVIFIFLFLALFSFYNYSHVPDIYILKRKKEIDYDLVYGTRQLIIEISSGMPLFNAMISITKGYGRFSKEITGIVERVTVGEPLSVVLKDAADKTPSPALKRVLLQIANSIVSGSDVANSLTMVVDQIIKDQIIEVKEYGQKLNPLVMFYLVLGVIFPTLGITFIIILMSFITSGAQLPFIFMVLIAILIGGFQLMFLALIETSRPRYAILG